jgi:hypothetical protein
MWKPGTLLRGLPNDVTNPSLWYAQKKAFTPHVLFMIVAVKETGFGTKGQMFDANILIDGMIVTLKNAHMYEDRFVYVVYM